MPMGSSRGYLTNYALNKASASFVASSDPVGRDGHKRALSVALEQLSELGVGARIAARFPLSL